MKRILALLSLFAAIAQALPATGQTLKVVNTVQDFRTFWTQAAGQPYAEQERLFTAFEARYPDVYANIVFPRSEPKWRERREARLRQAFARLPQAWPQIEAMLARADAIAATQAAAFSQEFAGLAPGTPVIFIPLSTFNAAVRPAAVMTSHGRAALVIGVDFLIDNGDALDVVFTHELFHLYHFERLRDKSFGDTMASPLWIEGLATHVSARLNPAQPARAIYMDSALAAACTPSAIAAWAGDYVAAYRQEAGNAALQSAWFRVAGDEKIKRRGYCLGAAVAARLEMQGHALEQMAGWDEAVYAKKIGAALQAMAAPPAP